MSKLGALLDARLTEKPTLGALLDRKLPPRPSADSYFAPPAEVPSFDFGDGLVEPGSRPPEREQLITGPRFEAAPERTGMQRVGDFFMGDPSQRTAIPEDLSAGQKIQSHFKQAVKGPMRAALKGAKGMLLNTPDIGWAIIKKVVPDDAPIQNMNLDQAMDWAMDYDPSGFSKAVSGLAEFSGGLSTAGKVIGKVAPQAGAGGKMIHAGATWGTGKAGREISKEIAGKVDPDADYGYEGAAGVGRDVLTAMIFSGASSATKAILESSNGQVVVKAVIQKFPRITDFMMKNPDAKIEQHIHEMLAKEGITPTAKGKYAVRHIARFMEKKVKTDIIRRGAKVAGRGLPEPLKVASDIPGGVKALPQRGYTKPARVSVKPDTSLSPRGKFVRTENGIIFPDGRKIITPVTESIKAEMENASLAKLTESLTKQAVNGVKGKKRLLTNLIKKKPEIAELSKSVEYDALVELANAGDAKAIDQLNTTTQGLDRPTYDQLVERVMQGDTAAADAIQAGDYNQAPPAPEKPAEMTTEPKQDILDKKVYEVPFSQLEGRFKRAEHARIVRQAIWDGKDVPAEVRAEYPELQPKAKAPKKPKPPAPTVTAPAKPFEAPANKAAKPAEAKKSEALRHPLAKGKTKSDISKMTPEEYGKTIFNPAVNRTLELKKQLEMAKKLGLTDKVKEIQKELGDLYGITYGKESSGYSYVQHGGKIGKPKPKSAPKSAPKQSWEMTQEEYIAGRKDPYAIAIGKVGYVKKLQQAVKDGKPVPREILEAWKSNGWARNALAKMDKSAPKSAPESTLPPGKRTTTIGGKAGKQREMFDKEKFKTLKASEADLAKDDIKGQATMFDKPAKKAAKPAESPTPAAPKKAAGKPKAKKAEPEAAEKSKVVDKNGKPLIVYHGTDKSFDTFDLTESGKNTDNINAEGAIFFSADPEIAATYSRSHDSKFILEANKAGIEAKAFKWKKSNIRPVTLDIKKPYIIDRSPTKKQIEYAKANGYDGIIVKNDGPGEYVIFSPDQATNAIAPVTKPPRKPEPVQSDAKIEAAKKPETLNYTQFAKKHGYISDYEMTDHGTLSPSGQDRISKRTKKEWDEALLSRIESNKQGHKAYEDAIKKGKVIDPDKKITKQGIEKEAKSSIIKKAKSEIDVAQTQIDFIEGLGKTSHTKSGRLKIGYQRAVDDYASNIAKAQARIDAMKKTGNRPGKVIIPGKADVKQAAKDIQLATSKLLQVTGIEPAKIVDMKLGKDVTAEVLKAIHNKDVASVEFDTKRLGGVDDNLRKMAEKFGKLPSKTLDDIMLTRGTPVGKDAIKLQQQAFDRLPKEFRDPAVRDTIDKIADFNYSRLQQLAGDDINNVEDYFYGIYKKPSLVKSFLKYWKSTDRYMKEKAFPTYADAKAHGLDVRDPNPINNLKSEFLHIAHRQAMTDLRDSLIEAGDNIKLVDDAPLNWGFVQDKVFDGYKVQPELAHLINNLIATNKISQNWGLNAVRKVNNVLRSIKFMGSAFHQLVIAKQSVADSGYLGFLKPTARKGATTGFRADDPIFSTPEYKDYIKHGGGHHYSLESQAQRALSDTIAKFNKSGKMLTQILGFPLRIPTGYVKWMFSSYIPKVKYSAYQFQMAEMEQKLGRSLKSSEKIEIIKEQQNLYGEMNERLFGRSGTMTSALRFMFMAPGFAEGNVRTVLKAGMQKGAGKSRANIINSLLLSAGMATVGTLFMTGHAPEMPKRKEDIRNLFKIDTGKVDAKGRKIYLDLLTYDKDYWEVYGNLFTGQWDKASHAMFSRLGGMTSTVWNVGTDLNNIMLGKAVYDWRENRVTEVTDPFIQKVLKLSWYEINRLAPISASVYTTARRKGVKRTLAAAQTLLGVRPTYNEADKREMEVMHKMWSLRDQREKLYYELSRAKDPRKIVKQYNKTLTDILESAIIPRDMKTEQKNKLYLDLDEYLQNKAFILTQTAENKTTERAAKVLKNFDVTPDQFKKLLRDRKARMSNRPKRVYDKLGRDKIIGPLIKEQRGLKRLQERPQ